MILNSTFILGKVTSHLEGGGVAILSLSNGSVAVFTKDLKVDSGAVIGTDIEGDRCIIGLQSVVAVTLTEKREPQETDGPEPLADWQAAFLRLRAACDESEDPAVRAAVADLEAIEEGQANAGE